MEVWHPEQIFNSIIIFVIKLRIGVISQSVSSEICCHVYNFSVALNLPVRNITILDALFLYHALFTSLYTEYMKTDFMEINKKEFAAKCFTSSKMSFSKELFEGCKITNVKFLPYD